MLELLTPLLIFASGYLHISQRMVHCQGITNYQDWNQYVADPQGILRVIKLENNPPFTQPDLFYGTKGLLVDLITELSRDLGFRYKLTTEVSYGSRLASGQWLDGAMNEIAENRADIGLIPISAKPSQFGDRFEFSDIYLNDVTIGILSSASNPIRHLQQLYSDPGLRIGTREVSGVWDYFKDSPDYQRRRISESWIQDPSLRYSSLANAVHFVRGGQLVFIDESPVIKWWHQNGNCDLNFLETTVRLPGYRLVFPAKSKIKGFIDRSLQKLSTNGVIDGIKYTWFSDQCRAGGAGSGDATPKNPLNVPNPAERTVIGGGRTSIATKPETAPFPPIALNPSPSSNFIGAKNNNHNNNNNGRLPAQSGRGNDRPNPTTFVATGNRPIFGNRGGSSSNFPSPNRVPPTSRPTPATVAPAPVNPWVTRGRGSIINPPPSQLPGWSTQTNNGLKSQTNSGSTRTQPSPSSSNKGLIGRAFLGGNVTRVFNQVVEVPIGGNVRGSSTVNNNRAPDFGFVANPRNIQPPRSGSSSSSSSFSNNNPNTSPKGTEVGRPRNFVSSFPSSYFSNENVATPNNQPPPRQPNRGNSAATGGTSGSASGSGNQRPSFIANINTKTGSIQSFGDPFFEGRPLLPAPTARPPPQTVANPSPAASAGSLNSNPQKPPVPKPDDGRYDGLITFEGDDELIDFGAPPQPPPFDTGSVADASPSVVSSADASVGNVPQDFPAVSAENPFISGEGPGSQQIPAQIAPIASAWQARQADTGSLTGANSRQDSIVSFPAPAPRERVTDISEISGRLPPRLAKFLLGGGIFNVTAKPVLPSSNTERIRENNQQTVLSSAPEAVNRETNHPPRVEPVAPRIQETVTARTPLRTPTTIAPLLQAVVTVDPSLFSPSKTEPPPTEWERVEPTIVWIVSHTPPTSIVPIRTTTLAPQTTTPPFPKVRFNNAALAHCGGLDAVNLGVVRFLVPSELYPFITPEADSQQPQGYFIKLLAELAEHADMNYSINIVPVKQSKEIPWDDIIKWIELGKYHAAIVPKRLVNDQSKLTTSVSFFDNRLTLVMNKSKLLSITTGGDGSERHEVTIDSLGPDLVSMVTSSVPDALRNAGYKDVDITLVSSPEEAFQLVHQENYILLATSTEVQDITVSQALVAAETLIPIEQYAFVATECLRLNPVMDVYLEFMKGNGQLEKLCRQSGLGLLCRNT